MNNQQAIHCLKNDYDEEVCEECDFCHDCTHETRADVARLAVNALEKQIPKKIDFEMSFGDCESRFSCACGKKIVVKHDRGVMNNHNAPNYCPNCGQALDWND